MAIVDRTQRLHAWERYAAAGIAVIDTDDPAAPPPQATAAQRRPFWLIDGRLREADFYLHKLQSAATLDDARHYFSAFTVAATALPDAIVRTLTGVPGFWDWWMPTATKLEEEQPVALLRAIRNQIVHEGLNPLGRFRRSHLGSDSFIITEDGERNANETGRAAMRALTVVVSDAYERFWTALDLPATLTPQELTMTGRTLGMIEREFGLPAGHSATDERTPEERLAWLREYSRTAIATMRQRYR